MKKILFKSAQEHWNWAYDNYLRFKTEDDNDLWGENKNALEPFFKWDSNRVRDEYPKMTKEEQKAFNLYKKVVVLPKHSSENKTIVSHFDLPELVDMLGFVYDKSQETDDLFSPIFKDKPLETRKDISYPCILLTWMEVGFDRMSGDNIVAINKFVSLSEFN